MKKTTITLLVAAAALGLRSISFAAHAEDENLHSEFMQGYYKAPDFAKALEEIQWCAKFKDDPPMPAIGFYFGIARSSPEKTGELEAALKGTWLECVSAVIAEGKTLDDFWPDDLFEIPPRPLDISWGYFFATGDADVPRRIIRRGTVKFPEDAFIDMTQQAAQWSVLAIARNDEIVRKELEAFIKSATDKELESFFEGKIPDYARKYLSEDAIKRIEDASKPKFETLEAVNGGFIPAEEGVSALVFTNTTIEALKEYDFTAKIGGKWVNGGQAVDAKGYNKEWIPGKVLKVQFQCVDKGDGKEYVKCVRVAFADSPDGVKAVAEYSGFVTLGFKKNALGYDFKDDANWKAVDSAAGEGYGVCALKAQKEMKNDSSSGARPKADAVEAKLPSFFTPDYDAALARAKADGRKLFVFFTGSDWCVWCKRLVKEVLSKDEFAGFATNEYECVVIDFPNDESGQTDAERRRNTELQEKFEVKGFPTVLIIDADEQVAGSLGYSQGGAKRWIEGLKGHLARAPYFAELSKESTAIQKKFIAELEKLGEPKDTETANRLKELLAKWAKEVREVMARLADKEMPEEFEKDRQYILDGLEKRIAGLERIAAKDVAELVKLAKESEAEQEENEDESEEKTPAPVSYEGSRSALEETAKVHLPFCERLIIEPEIAMAGGEFDAAEIRKVLREWALMFSPSFANATPQKKFLSEQASGLWKAGARTPMVSIVYLMWKPDDMNDTRRKKAVRNVWETWKDDPRWTLAAKALFLFYWREIESSDELTALSIDCCKKFIASDEWKRDTELDRARWILCQTAVYAKRIFAELKAEGVEFDPWLEAAVMASFYIDKAWEARGGGWASTVTDEGWEGYGANKSNALECVERAYALHPDQPWPFKIGVKANWGDKNEMWKWYGHAANVFKDDFGAFKFMAWGLRPRWCGSKQELLDFFNGFLKDDFTDTMMPIWALNKIDCDLFKDEGSFGKWDTFADWAEDNQDTIRRLSDKYLSSDFFKRPEVSLASKASAEFVFMDAAWACGDMEMYRTWRKMAQYDGSAKRIDSLMGEVSAYYHKGQYALGDWLETQPEANRAAIQRALSKGYGGWRAKDGIPQARMERALAPFVECVLPQICSGAITEKSAGNEAWLALRKTAGAALGNLALRPDGFDLAPIMPKGVWAEIDRKLEYVEVEAEFSIANPEKKGEAILFFDWGASSSDFYQRFGVLTVVNKTDEKDNRFAVLPWPKGELKKNIKVVFRSGVAEVYDNGVLAYSRQMKSGFENAKHLNIAHAGSTPVILNRLNIRARPKNGANCH